MRQAATMDSVASPPHTPDLGVHQGLPAAEGQRPNGLYGRLLAALPARQGAFWILVALAGPKVLGAATSLVLRRFLGPGVSGTFDLAATPYAFMDGFRNVGTGPALVYEKQVTPEAANTAWTLNAVAAILVAVLAQLLAHPIAVYYGRPAVEGIFRLLSIAYVLGSIGSVHYFLLLRAMNFRSRSVPALGQVIAAGAVAVLLAVWGFGIGALVTRELISAATGAVLLWAVYPFRPRPQLVPPVALRLMRYGIWVSTALTLLFVSQNVDIFIGGHLIRNTADIGFYATCWALAFISAGILTGVAGSMVFPTLSRLQDNAPALSDKLLTSVRQLGAAMFPAAALLAVLAPVIIVPLLGGKWAAYRSSFLVLSLLALYAGNRAMLSIFLEGYKSVGKPWLVWAYNAGKLVVLVPAMEVGAHYGILGMAAAYLPIQLLEIPTALLLVHRVLGVVPGAIWRACRPALLATLAMALLTIAVERLLSTGLHLRDVMTLALCLPIAGAVYLAVLTLLDRRILGEARRLFTHGL